MRTLTRREALRSATTMLGAGALSLAPEALSGCATQEPASSKSTGSGSSSTVPFAYQPGFSYGLFYVAQSKGWLSPVSVKLSPMTLFTDGAVQVDSLINHDFAASVQGFTPVLVAAAAGQPVKIVDVVDNSARSYAIVGKSDIDSVTGLAGKTVGVSIGSNYDYFLGQALRKYGMSESDLNVINFPDPAKAQSAFVAGRLDAIVPITTNRATILEEDKDARVIFTGSEFTQPPNPSNSPLAMYDLLVVTSESLTSSRKALTGLMQIFHTKVRDYVTSASTQPQVVDALYQWQTGVVKAQVSKPEIQTSLSEFDFYSPAQAKQIMASGQLADSLTSIAKFLMSAKKLTAMPDISSLISTSVVTALT